MEAEHIVPEVVEVVQVASVVMLDSIVSRSASRGSTGSIRGSVGQYCL